MDALVAKSSADINLDKETTEEMLEIRAFLAQQLEDSSNASSKSKAAAPIALEDTGHTLQKAIGQKTFDMNVDTNDLNEVIKNVYHKHHTVEAHNKFARFLRFTNVNIERVPFYPTRTEQLERLKHTAESLEKQCKDPEFMSRFQEVQSRHYARLEQPNLPSSPIKSTTANNTMSVTMSTTSLPTVQVSYNSLNNNYSVNK